MAAGYFTEDEIRNAIINAGYEIPGETHYNRHRNYFYSTKYN